MEGTDWIQTFTGRTFYPLDPRVEDLNIHDVAHALSNLCRFGGHCSRFYSVAEHSVHVAQLTKHFGASARQILYGLLHDASEAYLVDVPRPIKRDPRMAFYGEAEKRLMDVIVERWACAPTHEAFTTMVDQLDNDMLHVEGAALMAAVPAKWNLRPRTHTFELRLPCWSPEEAEVKFLEAFIEHAERIRHEGPLYASDLGLLPRDVL